MSSFVTCEDTKKMTISKPNITRFSIIQNNILKPLHNSEIIPTFTSDFNFSLYYEKNILLTNN